MSRFIALPDGWKLWERPKAKQRRGCAKKKRHDSEDAAQREAAFFGQRTYRCRVCGLWHLTSEEPRHG